MAQAMAGGAALAADRASPEPRAEQERVTIWLTFFSRTAIISTPTANRWRRCSRIRRCRRFLRPRCCVNTGFQCALFDPTLESLARCDGFEAALDRHQPRLVVVCEDDFNFLSKMCLARNRELAFRMAEMPRRRGIPIVAHGSDASDHVREYLRAGFDAVLIGEVETTLLELAQGKPREQIRGLAYLRRTGQSTATRRASYERIWTRCRCPPGTWSTSNATGAHGVRRTAISR